MGQSSTASYSERLSVPIWWYPAGLAVGLLLALEFSVILPGWWGLIPIVTLLPAAVGIVWRFSSGIVRVRDGALLAGDARVAAEAIDAMIALDPVSLRRLVGRHGDPVAFVFIRSWIGPGVQLVLDPRMQPDDARVPYWVVSSRRPNELLRALEAARTGLPASEPRKDVP